MKAFTSLLTLIVLGVMVLGVLLFAGEAMYGIAQLVVATLGQVAAQIQATLGSLV